MDMPATGTYAVVASDGFCSVRDTFTVSDIRDAYPLPWVDIPDTAICRDQLPFALMPIGSYTNQFTLDEQPFNTSTDIHQPGHASDYKWEHCPADTLFNLSTENCTAQVYIPNAFSLTTTVSTTSYDPWASTSTLSPTSLRPMGRSFSTNPPTHKPLETVLGSGNLHLKAHISYFWSSSTPATYK
ncbi:MAG: hypothetical protein R2795_21155 [Saprospiraceae bacterium]